MEIQFQVESWSNYNGIQLPQEAYRLARITNVRDQAGNPTSGGASLIRLVREQAKPIDELPNDEQLFSIAAMNDALIIVDHTLRMTYRPGESHYSLDGRRIETSAPITGYFGTQPPPQTGAMDKEARRRDPIGFAQPGHGIGLLGFCSFASISVLQTKRKHSLKRLQPVGIGLLIGVAIAGAYLIGITTNLDMEATSAAFAEAALVGESNHDFGDHEYLHKNTKLSHTFILTNESDESLRVQSVSASCGFTDASASKEVIAPGESVEVTAVLSVVAPRRSREAIWVNCGPLGIKTLKVEVNAFRAVDFTLVDASININAGPQRVSFLLTDRSSGDEPADTPMITRPDGVTAQFLGWQQIATLDRVRSLPATWIGTVEIASFNPIEHGIATFQFANELPSVLQLTGRPWLPEAVLYGR
ncbi:MAG: DUF1573 domain-containing protein [Phycisphaerales bacterium]